jgi:hypothetical protein
LSYSGNLLVDNRNRLIVDAEVFQANGTAERDGALIMLEKLAGTQSVTVGATRGLTRSGLWPSIGIWEWYRMWRKITNGRAEARLMVAPRGILGMPSARERGSGSTNASAG